MWTLKDFENYYANPKVKPYFNAYNRPPSDVYYNVKDAVTIASKLLEYQFKNNSKNINIFYKCIR